ncbi:MAG: NADH-quinone oxidoreductase subunit L [Chloroflexi bacterium]|nr:NADH-quinone oxidoreductase subunit L [Chloroflexota bacterium]MDA1147762.1 NADH-quinone oxidoreductase subunit L [Chloroflexota bacterium]MQC83091.1 NADH-quinone oxidoreductase subunit L [Chloroflexota bacterium]PKB56458.1 MAG: NADH-quinone oxidoreductase subunit L [SAR202 cluster bacterium Casp-Chloro-G1]
MILPDIPEAAVWAIYFAPLVSFLVIAAALLLKLPQFEGKHASGVTIGAIGLSWLLALWALDTSIGADGKSVGFASHPWVSLFELEIEFGVQLDSLSALMMFVVTSVSLVVQLYSTGYMHGDLGYRRYFMLMSLFTMAMLGLVMASSLLQLFIHWELVGLTSYLLVGFWFDRPAAAAAAKKAFIVTRFGDFFFLIAVVLIWVKTGGVFDIAEINHLAEEHELTSSVLTGFVLGIFAGAVGKSAQFPLHFWLPDAMEGPTPVSSLLHSATMVAAGVYLLSRFFPAVEAAPGGVATTIAYIGGFTAIFAASMGIAANDIKRVLAYSTISQLGYMVMAIGLGGFVAAIFHLFTHAFFKSLLFQGSGSVNHATGTFDMRQMGGLRTKMPVTFWTFLIGSLSLSGVFPLAGFWSKDEILLDAWHADKLLWVVGTTVAFMTAFYMFRAIFMTFGGEYRGGAEPEPGHGHAGPPHESPRSMTVPLIILAIPSIFFGLFALNGFGHFIEGTLVGEVHHVESSSVVVAASLLAALGGIGAAAAVYYARKPSHEQLGQMAGPLYTLAVNKYYVDEIAEDGIIRGALDRGIGRAAAAFDKYVVDGAVNGVALAARQVGDMARRLETGQLQAYTSMSMFGVVAAIVVLFVLRGNVLER